MSPQFPISGRISVSCLADLVVCIVVEEMNLNHVKTYIFEIVIIVLEHHVVVDRDIVLDRRVSFTCSCVSIKSSLTALHSHI